MSRKQYVLAECGTYRGETILGVLASDDFRVTGNTNRIVAHGKFNRARGEFITTDGVRYVVFADRSARLPEFEGEQAHTLTHAQIERGLNRRR